MIMSRAEVSRMLRKWYVTKHPRELQEHAVNLAETALDAIDRADKYCHTYPMFVTYEAKYSLLTLSDLCPYCGGFSQTLRAGKPWTCDDCGAVR